MERTLQAISSTLNGKREHIRRFQFLSKILLINSLVILAWAVIVLLWHLDRYFHNISPDYLELIIVGIGMGGIGLNYWFIRIVLSPFDALSETMEKVVTGAQQGHLEVRANHPPLGKEVSDIFIQSFNRMLDVIEKEHNRSKGLAKQLLFAQEEERKRIARELHDETNQVLAAITIGLEQLKGHLHSFDACNGNCPIWEPANHGENKSGYCSTCKFDPRVLNEKLEQLKKMTGKALGDLKKLAYNLRPTMLEEMGLRHALFWLFREQVEKHGIQVHFEAQTEDIPMPNEIELIFFRISQEAVANILKHSKATSVTVELDGGPGEVFLKITDNGIGFEAEKIKQEEEKHMGIMGMKERVELLSGSFEVRTSPGEGTSLSVSMPLAALVK